nr:immunoglobulin light chain junction region [Macaca mulatta]MOX53604.1 immunoglobulin light chain junction region [Macaca mulatta]MOX53808.1 immunoglobulin light chain junction region [Macaca mulatta]MOX55318.1 immunoglobulin light chain junction region [Macaca mulatta]MOX55961.1 immunoglobulin light chain junction region [Macaca mulatta]
CMQSLDFPYSF